MRQRERNLDAYPDSVATGALPCKRRSAAAAALAAASDRLSFAFIGLINSARLGETVGVPEGLDSALFSSAVFAQCAVAFDVAAPGLSALAGVLSSSLSSSVWSESDDSFRLLFVIGFGVPLRLSFSADVEGAPLPSPGVSFGSAVAFSSASDDSFRLLFAIGVGVPLRLSFSAGAEGAPLPSLGVSFGSAVVFSSASDDSFRLLFVIGFGVPLRLSFSAGVVGAPLTSPGVSPGPAVVFSSSLHFLSGDSPFFLGWAVSHATSSSPPGGRSSFPSPASSEISTAAFCLRFTDRGVLPGLGTETPSLRGRFCSDATFATRSFQDNRRTPLTCRINGASSLSSLSSAVTRSWTGAASFTGVVGFEVGLTTARTLPRLVLVPEVTVRLSVHRRTVHRIDKNRARTIFGDFYQLLLVV